MTKMPIQNSPADSIPPLLRVSPRIVFLPIVNGSGQFAMTTRRWLLEHSFDCIAVPLPPSFRDDVEAAVLELPQPSIVIQRPRTGINSWADDDSGWESDASSAGDSAGDDESSPTSYVPIDPCQSVVMAIRAAMGEHIDRQYIDLETDPFIPYATAMPDPFAVRQVAIERFAAAILPGITRPADPRTADRMIHMAIQLRELESRYQNILIVDNVLHWPWIRERYNELAGRSNPIAVPGTASKPSDPVQDIVAPTERYRVDSRNLMFLFGELPFITALYERARAELQEDDDVLIDGVKELLLAARDSYVDEFGQRGRRITPLLLSKCLQYIRNLSLMHRRMTPDMITIVTAAQQIFGDQFALHVAENANHYAFADDDPEASVPSVTLGIDQARLPDGEIVSLVNRLPGPPMTWTTLKLKKRPSEDDKRRWQHSFNPYGQCSYPPEDVQVENFRSRVFERAQAILGNDLAKTEKFTSSVKDGIDIRDTLRHWYEKQIYVKVIPPSRGTLDACVMIFDAPADPRRYNWRTTWFAEHKDESTLAFYATDFQKEMIGPGIGMATYGGALFLYPPVMIRDIWTDKHLDYAETLEERLIAAACRYSRSRQIAVLSALPPGGAWHRMARRSKKQLIHVPLSGFSQEHVQQMRTVHVLGGRQVRSYAADFIRKGF
jgi:hypothetical protein